MVLDSSRAVYMRGACVIFDVHISTHYQLVGGFRDLVVVGFASWTFWVRVTYRVLNVVNHVGIDCLFWWLTYFFVLSVGVIDLYFFPRLVTIACVGRVSLVTR